MWKESLTLMMLIGFYEVIELALLLFGLISYQSKNKKWKLSNIFSNSRDRFEAKNGAYSYGKSFTITNFYGFYQFNKFIKIAFGIEFI